MRNPIWCLYCITAQRLVRKGIEKGKRWDKMELRRNFKVLEIEQSRWRRCAEYERLNLRRVPEDSSSGVGRGN